MGGLVILCSGQGRQGAGMLEALIDYPEAQTVLKTVRAAGVLPSGIDRPELWFRNDIAQPLIALYQQMIWAVVKPLLPQPDIIAGYSLGEVSSYGIAGNLSPVETVRLAAERGRLMSDAAANTPQTMVAVLGLKQDSIAPLCERFGAHVAIINARDHFIIGLKEPDAEAFLQAAQNGGASKTVLLPLSVASHTPFMDTAAETFGKMLNDVPFTFSGSPVLAGISGEKVFTREQALAALTSQIYRTIDWQACLETAFSYGNRIFLELGPGHGLARMALEAFHGIEARSLSEFHDLRAVAKWFDSVSSREYSD